MKISIFLGSAGSNSGGPERYEIELIRSLASSDKENDYQIFSLFKRAPDVVGVQQDNVRYHVLMPQIRPVSMLTSLPLQMMRSQADVWHATYVPPIFTTQDYVFTLVCSSMFEHPKYYPPAIRLRLSVLMRLAIRKAGLILCISDHIRQIVKEYFAVPDDRLAVIYLGVSRNFRPIQEDECWPFLRERYGIDAPYFLFSGRWEPRKNIVRILEAFATFKKETKSDQKMVFTGARTWAAKEADDIIMRNNLEDQVIDLGKSPVDDLPMLYSGATSLVFPSLWEGFGLPIVEAMASGTPVITSNNSSMAEIGADASLLVDPLSSDEIAEAMHKIESDTAMYTSLRQKGLKRAKDFSWDITAQQTLAAYKQMSAARS